MITVQTGTPIVHRYDDVMDVDFCKVLCDEILKARGVEKEHAKNKLPWFENDEMWWLNLPNKELLGQLSEYRKTITKLVCESFKETVYPTYTDMVIWRMGKSMYFHKDNGYDHNPNDVVLKHRKYTSVLYLNDNYEGGETHIKTEWGDYISRPKTGSLVCFPSDESAVHGVTEIKSGTRCTMAIWFCDSIRLSEDEVYKAKFSTVVK